MFNCTYCNYKTQNAIEQVDHLVKKHGRTDVNLHNITMLSGLLNPEESLKDPAQSTVAIADTINKYTGPFVQTEKKKPAHKKTDPDVEISPKRIKLNAGDTIIVKRESDKVEACVIEPVDEMISTPEPPNQILYTVGDSLIRSDPQTSSDSGVQLTDGLQFFDLDQSSQSGEVVQLPEQNDAQNFQIIAVHGAPGEDIRLLAIQQPPRVQLS